MMTPENLKKVLFLRKHQGFCDGSTSTLFCKTDFLVIYCSCFMLTSQCALMDYVLHAPLSPKWFCYTTKFKETSPAQVRSWVTLPMKSPGVLSPGWLSWRWSGPSLCPSSALHHGSLFLIHSQLEAFHSCNPLMPTTVSVWYGDRPRNLL